MPTSNIATALNELFDVGLGSAQRGAGTSGAQEGGGGERGGSGGGGSDCRGVAVALFTRLLGDDVVGDGLGLAEAKELLEDELLLVT